MQKKLLPSLAAAVLGAGLLVGASFASSAGGSAPAKAGSGEAKRGGTLRVNLSTTDFEYVDPALAYDAYGWGVLYMTNLMLLNYPDKPAPEGSRLVPDAAVGFPRVSRDGKTYTFTIKSGLKFSDGSPVTAAAFKRAFERAADPKQASPAIAFMHDVVGADARNEEKAASVTGITANGQTLTIRLTQANPTFLAEVAMPFFAAVKPSMAVDSHGLNVYPSAGPYKIVSRAVGSQLVLERNTFYKGRPAGERRPHSDHDEHGSRTRACSRFAPARSTTTSSASRRPRTTISRRQYGVKKGGNGRYFVNTGINTTYLALNTSRAALGKVNLRKAVNFAIDRPAMLRVAGKFAGKRTDQILPPNMQGFRDAKLYPIKGADPAKGDSSQAGAKDNIDLLYTDQPDVGRPGADHQVQPRADRSERDPEAAAVRRRDPHRRDAGLRLRHVPDRLVRGLPGPVRLHQRAVGRAEHPACEQLELLVPEQPEVQQADDGRVQALRRRSATTRTGSSTWT